MGVRWGLCKVLREGWARRGLGGRMKPMPGGLSTSMERRSSIRVAAGERGCNGRAIAWAAARAGCGVCAGAV